MNLRAWKRHAAARWVVGFLFGYAAVTVVALAREWVIETYWGLEDQPHWFSTMPLLALLIAYLLQKRWRRESSSQATPSQARGS